MCHHRLIRLSIIPLALALGPFARAQAAADACAVRAGTMLDALGRKDYAAASATMGAKLRAAPQQKMLASMWEALIRHNWGPYRSHGEATVRRNGDGSTTIRLPLQFDHGATTATITCDPQQAGAIDEFVLL